MIINYQNSKTRKMIALFFLFGATTAATGTSCSICMEAETDEGEMCQRACDFCRGYDANVHFSCLLKYHRQQKMLNTKCPNCRRHLGPRFNVVYYQEQLANFEREYGPDHGNVAVTLTNLGNAYGILGDLEKKQNFLERALAIEEREYGPDHRELTVTLANLGNA